MLNTILSSEKRNRGLLINDTGDPSQSGGPSAERLADFWARLSKSGAMGDLEIQVIGSWAGQVWASLGKSGQVGGDGNWLGWFGWAANRNLEIQASRSWARVV